MQDWTPIQFSQKPRTVQTKAHQNPQIRALARLDDETDELKHELVSPELKIAIMQGRQAKQLTQQQLAHALSVSVQIIKEYECGRAIPENAFIARLERFLCVKLPRQKK